MSKLADIHMQVMWNRLISVVEEQAQTLVRTAFGAATREAGDLSAGVFLPACLIASSIRLILPSTQKTSTNVSVSEFPQTCRAAGLAAARSPGFAKAAPVRPESEPSARDLRSARLRDPYPGRSRGIPRRSS